MEDVYDYRNLKLRFILGYRIDKLDDHHFYYEKSQVKKVLKQIVKKGGASDRALLDSIMIGYVRVILVVIELVVQKN